MQNKRKKHCSSTWKHVIAREPSAAATGATMRGGDVSMSRIIRWIVAAGVCAGCASSPQRRTEPTALHAVTCRYVGLESAQGPSDSNADSLTLFAVYRFSDSNADSTPPLALKFQVSRSRVGALQEHLAARPEVVCSPDNEAHYSAQVEPFEGIPGIPHR